MILAIDTSTANCSVALFADDGALIDSRDEVIGRGHAERLMPMVEQLLAGRTPTQILVGCGPGSFTGLRVGLAAAAWDGNRLGHSACRDVVARPARGGSPRRWTGRRRNDRRAWRIVRSGVRPSAARSGRRTLEPVAAGRRECCCNAACRRNRRSAARGGTRLRSSARSLSFGPPRASPARAASNARSAPALWPRARCAPPASGVMSSEPQIGAVPDRARRRARPRRGHHRHAIGIRSLVRRSVDSLAMRRNPADVGRFALCRAISGLRRNDRFFIAACGCRRSRIAVARRRAILAAGAGSGARYLANSSTMRAARGAHRLHLEVRDGNPAVRMYRLAGFDLAGRRSKYYHGAGDQLFDALTFARTI